MATCGGYSSKSVGKLQGSDLKIDRSENRSRWAESCPYVGTRSIFYRVLRTDTLKFMVMAEAGPIMA